MLNISKITVQRAGKEINQERCYLALIIHDYQDGILTPLEFCDLVAQTKKVFKSLRKAGLYDLQTGLRNKHAEFRLKNEHKKEQAE